MRPIQIVVDKVSARMHRIDALRFVNYVRYELGFSQPLKKLCPGDIQQSERCPIAESIRVPGAHVSVTEADVEVEIPSGAGTDVRHFRVPPEVTEFIRRFDSGRYPDLQVPA